MLRARIAWPLAALALLAAGCGGSSSKTSSTGGGSIPAGAGQVSAKAQVFVSLDSSFGDQWDAFNALIDRFPIRGQAIDAIHKGLTDSGVDFDKDIKATVGPELDVAVWSIGQGQTSVVGLTQPKDKTGFEAALKKGADTPPVFMDDGDWVLFSDKQATLDAFKALGGGTLADDSSFQDGFHALSDGELGRVYVNTTGLEQQAQKKLKSSSSPFGALGSGSLNVQWVAAGLQAQKEGFKLDAVVNSKGANASNFKASVLDDVPAGSFVAAAFDGSGKLSLGAELKQLEKNPQLGPSLAQLQSVAGVSLNDVAKLFAGQGVFYVRAGTPIPEVTFIEDGVDAKQSVNTLDTIATHLQSFTHAAPQPATVDGVSVQQISIQGLAVYYGAVDGKLILTSSQAGITDLKSGGSKLADDDSFKKAAAGAGFSADETEGLLYVDLQNAVATLGGLAGLAGASIPPAVQPNLENLRGFLLSAHADDGDTVHVTAFLGVQPGSPVPATHTSMTALHVLSNPPRATSTY